MMKKNDLEKASSHAWIRDIIEEDRIESCYLVREKSQGTTRNGKPFLTLTLSDRTGEIPAVVWEKAEEFSSLFVEGEAVVVAGLASSYRGKLQVTVSALKRPEKEPDSSLFCETSPMDPSRMMRSLKEVLRGVSDPHLRTLVDRFLSDRKFTALLKKAPAAKNFHHSYLGGLLEHTLSVCEMAVQIARHYPQLNGDLLVVSAFLHDIGKIREFTSPPNIEYTDEGRLIGHLVSGVEMLNEKLEGIKSFPADLAIRLKHLILSHHGQFDFGSPKEPAFLEAFALNFVDDIDAKISGLGRFMERDRREGAWTEFHRLFRRYLLKGDIVPPEKGPEEENVKISGEQASLF